MENVSVALEQFDVKGFLDAYVSFYQSWGGGDVKQAVGSTSSLASYGEPPMPTDPDADLYLELVERGTILFIPFHEPAADYQVRCMDGSLIEDPEDGEPVIDIGLGDLYGYVIEVRDEVVHIAPGLYDGSSTPIPSLMLQHRCGAFDGLMEKFVDRFRVN